MQVIKFQAIYIEPYTDVSSVPIHNRLETSIDISR